MFVKILSMSRCEVMLKVILLMMFLLYCQGFPLREIVTTVTTTESDYSMSNESEIFMNNTAIDVETTSPESHFETFEIDNQTSSMIIFNNVLIEKNTNLSQTSDTSEIIPMPARLTTTKITTEKICIGANSNLWHIQQNITDIDEKLKKIEKINAKISYDIAWLRVANIGSAVLSASCIAPVLVIMCRLKLPAPTI